jgi:glycosyltransferase involved in cell wall biosynthesis
MQFIKMLGLFPKMVHYSRHMARNRVTGANACWASLPATLTLVAKQFFGIPYCMTCRAWDIFIPMNQIGLDEKISHANAVRTNHDVGVELMKRFCRSESDLRKVTRIYNPFDASGLVPRTRLPSGEFVITAGGSLGEKKGLRYLLDAVAILKRSEIACSVKIVGDGPERSSLEKRIGELRLEDRVEMLGNVPNQRFLEQMTRSGVFVLPSIPTADGCMDGIPNVLIESLALGVPAISTSISAIPELIEDGVSGLLVPPKDAQALAEAIRRMMNDKELQRRCAKNGRDKVERMFDMRQNTRALIDLYRAGGVL